MREEKSKHLEQYYISTIAEHLNIEMTGRGAKLAKQTIVALCVSSKTAMVVLLSGKNRVAFSADNLLQLYVA